MHSQARAEEQRRRKVTRARFQRWAATVLSARWQEEQQQSAADAAETEWQRRGARAQAREWLVDRRTFTPGFESTNPRPKACYQRANLTEAAQSADYRSRGDRPEAMGDVRGDCATVQPRSRRRIVDPTFPLKIPSGYAAAFGLCGFSSAVSLPYLTLP